MYAVEPAESDPAMAEFPDVEYWEVAVGGGLATTENGTAMTYSELKDLVESDVNVRIHVTDGIENYFYPLSAQVSTVPNDSKEIIALYVTTTNFYGVGFNGGGSE